jgi:Tol biopolymer transport system component
VRHLVGRVRRQGLTQLVETPNRWEWTPVYSPDGNDIAFGRGVGTRAAAPADLWVMGSRRLQPHRITDTGRRDEFGLSWQSV